MAGSVKKPRKPTKSESDHESVSDESESGTYHGQNEIHATFEGRNPEANDFHGIKQLLHQLFLKAHIDLSQMSDLLINQHGVGSVLKQSYEDSDDEDDADTAEQSDVFGITSVINLGDHKELTCIQQFFTLLDELSTKHADQQTQDTIKRILTQHQKIGFLLNERFVNIPAKISVVMLNSLYAEIEKMKKKSPSHEFQYYIMICKTSKPKEDTGDEIFSNDEEEIFAKEAEINFDFNVSKDSDTGLGGKWLAEDKQMVPFRRILIFQSEKLRNIINQVTAFVES